MKKLLIVFLFSMTSWAAISRDGYCSGTTNCTVAGGGGSGASASGDLMLAFAYRNASTTAPSLPSGYTAVYNSSGGSTNSFRVYCHVASGTSDATGTATNATGIVAVWYSGVPSSVTTANCGTSGVAIGIAAAENASQIASSTTVNYLGVALASGTSSSWVVGFMGDNVASDNCTPSTMTGLLTANQVTLSDTNAAVASWAAATCSVTSATYRSFVLEVLGADSGAGSGTPSLVQSFGGAGQTTSFTGQSTTLSAAITSGATTMTIAAASSIANTNSLIIDPGTSSAEIVFVSSGGGTTTLTVVRGQWGTTAVAHVSGAYVSGFDLETFGHNTGQGNMIALIFNAGNNTTVPRVSDDHNNAYFYAECNDTGNSNALWLAYATNVAAGARKVYVSWTSAGGPGNIGIIGAEFTNVALSAAVEASSCNFPGTTETGAQTATAGSVTPTNSSDLVIQATSALNTINPTAGFTYTAGSQSNITWALFSAEDAYDVGAQWGVYSSTAAMNASMTQNAGSTSAGFQSLAVFFRRSSAGTAAPAGMQILSKKSVNVDVSAPWNSNPRTVQVPCPTSTNLVVLEYQVGQFSNGQDVYNVTSSGNTFLPMSPVTISLSSGINSSVTSMSVSSGASVTNNDYLQIDGGLTTNEIVQVTAGGGTSTLTITRGQMGTTGQSHSASARITDITPGCASESCTHNYYAGGASWGPTSTLTMNFSAMADAVDWAEIYCVSGAASSPYDKTVDATGSQGAAGNLTLVSLSPSTSNGIVFVDGSQALNTTNGFTTAGMYYDGCYWSNEATGSAGCAENNPWGHYANPGTSSYTFIATQVSGTTAAGTWDAQADAFKWNNGVKRRRVEVVH